jgi:hypothetical protein
MIRESAWGAFSTQIMCSAGSEFTAGVSQKADPRASGSVIFSCRPKPNSLRGSGARSCRRHLTAALSRPLYRPTATSMARFTREEVARWAAVIMAADVKLE